MSFEKSSISQFLSIVREIGISKLLKVVPIGPMRNSEKNVLSALVIVSTPRYFVMFNQEVIGERLVDRENMIYESEIYETVVAQGGESDFEEAFQNDNMFSVTWCGGGIEMAPVKCKELKEELCGRIDIEQANIAISLHEYKLYEFLLCLKIRTKDVRILLRTVPNYPFMLQIEEE